MGLASLLISLSLLMTCYGFLFSCKTCGEYIYKGKKFNARKETVQNEVYLGLPIFRFYIKCTRCLAEITFKVKYFLSALLLPGEAVWSWAQCDGEQGCPSTG